ncbi:DUF418 domain-containing protein [Gallaecimonas sp. GXIMD4217]|uniref:DUF418 domain-containing protein n=1 Tax=Gallaecimonas sp. GXIMD4217 TaxID=3131927 RepID=UPI00311B11BE
MSRDIRMDSARGLAIFGILLINIQSFAVQEAGRFDPFFQGPPSLANGLAWWLQVLLVDHRFISLFALLFGMGLAWLKSRGPLYQFRRLKWLVAFGVIHGLFIWEGDILLSYGLTAMVVLNLMDRSVLWRLRAGLGALALALALGAVLMALPGGEEEAVDLVLLYRDQGYGEQLLHRFLYLFFTVMAWPFSTLWWVGALMLLGSALAERPHWQRQLAASWPLFLLAGLALTLPGALALWYGGAEPSDQHGLITTLELAGPIQALGYLGFCYRHGQRLPALAAAGRWSFSHYLLQSLVMTSLSYGAWLLHPLARWQLLLLALGYGVLLARLSPLLVGLSEQGPMERLWRRLSRPHRE